jgi:hypothetical protein
MARLVSGKTINSWAVIPVSKEGARLKQGTRGQDGDIDELFLNAISMRWLIIDECSAASPGLLGTLDAFLRRACMSHPYAKDGARPRPFGGINVLFAGDLWQLPPVRDKPIFANPYAAGHELQEQWIMKMFWQKETRAGQRNSNAIQRSFTLKDYIQNQSNRIKIKIPHWIYTQTKTEQF